MMLKTIVRKITLLLLLSLSLSAEVDFENEQTIDELGFELGLAGLKEKIAEIPKKNAGVWYLKIGRSKIYDKVKNDEFEYDAAVNKSYEMLVQKINDAQSYIGKKAIVKKNNEEFGEYDFDKERFSVNIGQIFRGRSHVKFDNVNIEKHVISMKKTKAKDFIQKRKDSRGRVNRNITTVYHFNIVKVSSPEKVLIKCSSDNNCNNLSPIEVVGHITKLEFLDKDGTVLTSHDF